MNKITEQIKQWADEALAGTDSFVVDIKQSEDKIKLYIDGDEGVSIYRCADLSSLINAKLDEANPEHLYALEVSSPGADRPLKYLRQYPKHVGRKLELKMKDGKVITNMLKEVKGDTLIVGEKITNLLTKRKPKPDEEVPFAEIEEGVVIISFS
jgi:ribosome maturation factor RimP